jgi:hypothetical protein
VRVLHGWAEVARVADELRAALLADRLRSEDVEAMVFSQKDRWHVVTFGGLAVVRVLVPAASYERAARLLGSDLPRVAG